MEKNNPFAALTNIPSQPQIQDKQTVLLEGVFGFTLDSSKNNTFIYLEELTDTFSDKQLNIQILEHALFERLMLTNSEDFATKSKHLSHTDFGENRVIIYLCWCYKRCDNIEDESLRETVRRLIVCNASTALRQPELYDSQNLIDQLYTIFKDMLPLNNEFFVAIYDYIAQEDVAEGSLSELFQCFLTLLVEDVSNASPTVFPSTVFLVLKVFTTSEGLANILLDFSQPKGTNGAEFGKTLLGALFNISILPKSPNDSYEFFQNPLDVTGTSTMEKLLWSNTEKLSKSIHELFRCLLKCSLNIKSRTLIWLGNCLETNTDRGKLWHHAEPNFNHPPNYTTVGDGFMINFCDVMLQFCNPFVNNIHDGKILKVDPTYCAVSNDDCASKGIHLLNLSKETSLVPPEDDSIRPTAESYNFITECFYMTHRAVELGYKTSMDKLIELNHQVERIQRDYQEVMAQSALSEVTDSLRTQMESKLTKYFSLKSRLCEPVLLDNLFSFAKASAYWLCNVAVCVQFNQSTYAPLTQQIITFPCDLVPDTIKCIPELLIENVVSFLIFLRRFNPKVYEEQGVENIKPLLTFILIYMRSDRTRNPHLRARLAEALEALLPFHKDEPTGLNPLGGQQRKQLFTLHEHRNQIVPALLDVFVGIEMTGESVQFEQKFNYRRPMYAVLDYLWQMDEYQQNIIDLAKYAEMNMDSVTPPIFLRFINLLINDAIFLLDEALANMAKLKEMQLARERGEWDSVPVNERIQNISYMQHISMLARFDNILGKDTIQMLVCLTSKITIVFTHSSMVDRVASMLNYFLLNLVGPNQKNFKVKDQQEYSFDPAGTVLNICKIYVNLKENEAFCLAVSQDGRCYSPKLFKLAEDVLIKIGGGLLIGELQELANNVQVKHAESKINEELASEAPDHFLDPIMSTLMTDPVILPSSKQIVDRTTIARHLLSDQSDPFNRAPLTMDQVQSATELRDEIVKWIEERKK